MKMSAKRELSSSAFRLTAVAAMAASSFASGGAWAQAAAPAEGSTKLDTVEVTGSRLRRVDTETASPVYMIDRAAIETSGVTSLGELLQEMPSISGAATNPQVNNGGGTGAAVISLRGLGEERTLTLLNGRRLGASFDINSIPINMIERVEVLKEGAGAIYGSDAVGGVVNFITRKGYTGLDVAAQWGESSEGDGQNKSVEAVLGVSNDRGGIMLGVNYNKQKAVSAAARKFSEHALYIYNYYGADTVLVLGSSRNPRGRISLPATDPLRVALGGCGSVTRIPGQDGNTNTAADYRCYSGGADSFDYQPFNLVVTPQERGSLFSTMNYKLNDSVEVFADMFHNFTQAGFIIAPLPFDARQDNVVISQDSIYNPFGIDFGGAPATPTAPVNPNFLSRFVTNGNRFNEVETTTDQIAMGLRGAIGDTAWNWDLAGTYQRVGQTASFKGYVLQGPLQNALGASFIDDNGTPTTADDVARCGAPGAVIANCTPINIFNTEDPQTVAQAAAISSGYTNKLVQTTKIVELNFNGNLFAMGGGTAQGAVGISYRKDSLGTDVDELVQSEGPDFKDCKLSSETCSGDSFGDDSVKELYGEMLLPIVSGVPGAEALNLTLGARYSDYDSFGSTTNFTGKIEYRPMTDLMVRVSYAEVFRAPTITDRYAAPAVSNPIFFDPCVGLVNDATDTSGAPNLATNPNLALACVNVPTDGSFAGAPTQQIQQLILSTPNLDPETGDVLTFGVVYDPNWLPNASMSVDVWRYSIDDAIIATDVNTLAATCAETGDVPTCSLITRFSDGQIQQILSPTLNSANFTTDGVDLGLKYKFSTPVGKFSASSDLTYTHSFKYRLLSNSTEIEAAGNFDAQFGNYAKWRTTTGLWWDWMGFDAQLVHRFIAGQTIAASFGQGSGRPAASGPLTVGGVSYLDASFGYNLEKTKTKFMVGVENIGDKQPPLYYQYVLNANTNVETYDSMGRFFYVRVSQSF